MPSNLWNVYTSLSGDELRVLRAIERWMRKYRYVPVELVERTSRLPPSRFSRAVKTLVTLKLVKRRLGSVSGYTLTYTGLDVLAIDNLRSRGIVEVLGDKIGLGKEGDVYVAVSPAGSKLTVKLHRAGRESFRKVRRHRSYALDLRPTSWLDVSKALAEREFKILVRLEEEGARIPSPVAWNRHAVVQRYVEGVLLADVRVLDTEAAASILRDVLETLRIAYTRVGVVHGDLSEYNVIATTEGRGVVIDWPQYVYRDEPHALELLRRDVEYILKYFRRRAGLKVELASALRYVMGESREPPV
ncbi:putative kinase [Aeropyrum pernix K1]|uniref:non-specific serine/threonine protein kinase n=1 Tax=Aeropyrum pernix (strain ATCC 700893 / DSM 11879 / JCM 9820 / NBRC 100138 / K1) TaxID=272557 RepID=Q9YBJ6_AERPE|nr:serine/threonine-protein kinase RIO2 [Aeropyrum pernix]BAA80602.2 putative kinase [Aeropyrum pernix K1]